jgi:RNA polymerase sigma-70 factor (ECF subfamily)
LDSWTALDDVLPALRRFLADRCRDDAELDDVVQETLVRAARYRATLSDPAKLRSWSFRIAVNVLTDRVRRETRQRLVASGSELLPDLTCPDSEEDLQEIEVDGQAELREEVLAVLTEAVADLRERDRRLLDSYYGGSGSCRETAEDCGLPQELVKVHLFRARRRLQGLVTRRLGHRRSLRQAAP